MTDPLPKRILKTIRERFTQTKERVSPRRTAWDHLEEDLLGGHSCFRRWAVAAKKNWKRLRRWWRERP